MNRLVPKDFQVPEVFETNRLRLIMLTVNDVVKQWIKDKWPFMKPGYPGRDINWEAWKSLK